MHQTILITGATSGIGYIAALAFARQGHTVLFNARDLQKGERIQKQLKAESGNSQVFCFEADFASLASVSRFANQVTARFPVLDVLVHNAGTWEMAFHESQDGIELNFAVNHLAPFLLTLQLIENGAFTPKGEQHRRIVVTSSGAHRRNILQFEDIEFRQGEYNGFYSYAQSKLCNLLFSLQLEKELAQRGLPHVTVNTLHPGLVRTALFDQMTAEQRSMFGAFVSPEEGAETTIFLATSEKVEGISGKYWHRDREAVCTEMAQDAALAAHLWELSLRYARPFLHQREGAVTAG